MFHPDKLQELISKPVEAKPDPFSLADFILWLEGRPKDAVYNFLNCNGVCLIGQWMTFSGYADETKRDFNRKYNTFCDAWAERNGASLASLACRFPWTFGAALSRARALAGQV